MKTVFNRFAILPKHCPDCHRYIWLEKYRRADVLRKDGQGYIRQNICSDCIKKYVGDLNGRKIVT